MTISTHARILILACSLVSGQVAFGQTFGSIDGEARDASGAAVAGVTISATNKGTNAARTATTNDAGAYSFPSLAPGTYTLRAEKPGFKTEPLLSPLLDDISKSTNIAFWRGNTLVDSFGLRKSRKAVAALRKCAEGLYRTNPSDPFAH